MNCICVENGERITRHVERMQRIPEVVLDVYDRIRKVPNLFSAVGGVKVEHLSDLLNPNYHFWLVDDIGIICVIPLLLGVAHAHITFWDRRLRGREELARKVAFLAMYELGVRTLLTAIPHTSKATLAFAKRVGFTVLKDLDRITLLQLSIEAL